MSKKPDIIRVACIGDSITYGSGIKTRVIIWHKLAPLFKGQKFFGDPRVDALNDAIAKVAKAEDIDTIDMSKPFEAGYDKHLLV